ncbi:MAG: sugar ABC transporter permease [candidate division KSB1 bacterium]|nr:sugar ABC transporter permease [candidate division KSB1 bacterium]MDZ7366553.1 sugar ABC transporter permease [candidate division KSB1 bacterium]MDZ7405964.1 sugar ABC transporter permease [candidate division KSB1 bacterium]
MNNSLQSPSLRGEIRSLRRAAYLFLAPALLPILAFFFLPALAAFVLSFTDFDIYSLGNFQYARFVGLKNYRQLLHDPLFWKAMANTFYYVLLGGPLSIATSLGAALLINSRLVRFRSFFQTVYFAPVVTTLVAVAVVWRFIYHPRFGLLNYALGFFGVAPIDWLGDPAWAMPAIIIMSVWKNFGYNMIIFVAGLQNIPSQLYEASRLDGAGPWQQFTSITLPMLAPTTIFVSIIAMIGNFQLFTEPYVMTQGGPVNSTLSIVLLMYQQGFRWWNLGYAAAIAFVLFGVILLGSLIQSRLQKRT